MSPAMDEPSTYENYPTSLYPPFVYLAAVNPTSVAVLGFFGGLRGGDFCLGLKGILYLGAKAGLLRWGLYLSHVVRNTVLPILL